MDAFVYQPLIDRHLSGDPHLLEGEQRRDRMLRLLQSSRGQGEEPRPAITLKGRHLALLNEPAGAGNDALCAAAHDLGLRISRIELDQDLSADELVAIARMMARLYDAIDTGTLPIEPARMIARHCGIPVFDGLGLATHPARVLSDLNCVRASARHRSRKIVLRAPRAGNDSRIELLLTSARLLGLRIRLDNDPGTSIDPVDGCLIDTRGDTGWRLFGPQGPIPGDAREHAYRFLIQALILDAFRADSSQRLN